MVALCAETDYRSISVAEIARKAGVNRATFYLHFEDKDDLLERGFESFLEGLGKSFRDRPPGLDDEAGILLRITALFELFEERRSFFLAILSGVGASALMEKASEYLERFLIEHRFRYLGPSRDENLVPIPVLARAVVSTLTAFASWWLRGEAAYTNRSGTGRVEAGVVAGWYIRFARAAVEGAGYDTGWAE